MFSVCNRAYWAGIRTLGLDIGFWVKVSCFFVFSLVYAVVIHHVLPFLSCISSGYPRFCFQAAFLSKFSFHLFGKQDTCFPLTPCLGKVVILVYIRKGCSYNPITYEAGKGALLAFWAGSSRAADSQGARVRQSTHMRSG